MADVEAEVVAAGASPASVEVRVEEVPERSIAACGRSRFCRPDGGRDTRARRGRRRHAARPAPATAPSSAPAGRYWLLQHGDEIEVLDRYGDEAIRLRGEEVPEDELAAAIERLTRYRGPITLRPTTWIIDDRRLLELGVEPASTNPLRGTAGRHLPRRKAALMALYISAGRRFRRTLVIAVAAAVVAFVDRLADRTPAGPVDRRACRRGPAGRRERRPPGWNGSASSTSKCSPAPTTSTAACCSRSTTCAPTPVDDGSSAVAHQRPSAQRCSTRCPRSVRTQSTVCRSSHSRRRQPRRQR